MNAVELESAERQVKVLATCAEQQLKVRMVVERTKGKKDGIDPLQIFRQCVESKIAVPVGAEWEEDDDERVQEGEGVEGGAAVGEEGRA